jgi:hypothetical protein
LTVYFSRKFLRLSFRIILIIFASIPFPNIWKFLAIFLIGFLSFFCEKNVLAHVIEILTQRGHRQCHVAVQVLQTLSILVQNLHRPTSMYYLLSNNHINDLILHDGFDFGDEEVVAYYVSFLKILSLKLDRNSLQFFFDQDEGTFPLYTQAIQVIFYSSIIHDFFFFLFVFSI